LIPEARLLAEIRRLTKELGQLQLWALERLAKEATARAALTEESEER
jgi:hypothetical protein